MDEILLSPLAYPFFVRGLIAAIVVGIASALIGSYVVLKGMAFLGDALAHAILPGVAIGYVTGGGQQGAVFWWSLVTAGLTSLAIGAISRGTKIKEDTATGVLFAGMFALGIAIISRERTYAVDLAHFLFGDVLGVSDGDLLLSSGMGGVFPPGYPVARVTRIVNDPNEAFLDIRARPVARIGHHKEVMLIWPGSRRQTPPP